MERSTESRTESLKELISSFGNEEEFIIVVDMENANESE